ncbi:Uncharacterised protein [uncultured archaeon]|nr:Uncharacterised protein [uncultured archaeon]
MNPFAKAAILTVVVVFFAAILVAQVDAWRTQELRSSIDQVVLQSESNRLMQRMADLIPTQAQKCAFFNSSGELSKVRAYELATRIQDYQRANFFGSDYAELKQTYFISLSDLYLFTMEQNKECPQNRETPLLYFYREQNCPQCRAQDAVLERVAARCGRMRIFAFPTDANYPFLSALAGKMSIKDAPQLVVGETPMPAGLQDDGALVRALNADGASCQ